MAKRVIDWAAHIEGFERSGVRRAEYCRKHGLCESSMAYHLSKVKNARAGGRFVGVGVTAPLEVMVGKCVVRVSPGSDLSELRRVVEALSC